MAIYRLLGGTSAFDPETIQAMYSAYEDVCKVLGLTNDKNDRVTELVAMHIIEVAKAGETDRIALRDSALKALGVGKP